MSKRRNSERTDTVSSVEDITRVISNIEDGITLFDYKFLCKKIISIPIRTMDACILVPFKLYYENRSNPEHIDCLQIEEWLNTLQNKRQDYWFIWTYMVYESGYQHFDEWKSTSSKNNIKFVMRDIKTHLADISKLSKSAYMKQLCQNRDAIELWILNAYEITLKKVYSVLEMASFIKTVINYLKKCNIDLKMPNLMYTEQSEKRIFQIAANLLLLIARLRLGISQKKAVEWYKSGNIAYLLYVDQMLDEYMELVSRYPIQSYERFMKMQIIAKCNTNKYAAKEVGDIYRLGVELQDAHGNRINIEQNEERACEFYTICVEYEYIPAYIPAIKTEKLINNSQKMIILEKAIAERNPEGLVYYADQCIAEADNCCQTDWVKAVTHLKEAAKSILTLEEGDGEKLALKNRLILSKSFQLMKENSPQIDDDTNNIFTNLYSTNVFVIDSDEMLLEVEKTYLLASQQGYFEAEYVLGMLFKSKDDTKSQDYFLQGKEKGCKYSMLKYAELHREENPEEWLQIMMYLGTQINGNNELQILLAKEWTSNYEEFIKSVKNKTIDIKIEDLMQIYLQIDHLLEAVYKSKMNESEQIKEYIAFMSEVATCHGKLRELLLVEINNSK